MDMKQKRISSFFAARPKQQSVSIASQPTPAPRSGRRASPAKPDKNASSTEVTPAGKATSETKVATPNMAVYGQQTVGKSIEVFWPLDEAWYRGVVKDYSPQSKKHKVHYEDDEVEWIHLHKEQVRILSNSPSRKRASPGGKKASPAKKLAFNLPAKSQPRTLPTAAEPGTSPTALETSTEAQKPKTTKRLRPSKEAAVPNEDVDLELLDDCEDEVDDDMDEDVDFKAEEEEDDEDDINALELEDLDDLPIMKRPRVSVKDKRGPTNSLSTPIPLPPSKSLQTPASTEKNQAAAFPRGPMGSAQLSCTPTGTNLQTPASTARQVDPTSTVTKPRPAVRTPGSNDTQRRCILLEKEETNLGKESLRKNGGPTSPTPGKQSAQAVCGVSTNVSSDGELKYMNMCSRFTFLHPEKIKDKAGRRPSHPDYNPRTLYVPSDIKLTEAQQQWWQLKSENFDSVLLFKVGKFYEMFEMDAFVGVDVMGLQFMKSEKPHAGFPEMAYTQMAESLARAGYRVVVVEQTETPSQLAERNKTAKKKANVVARSKVAVLSKGTLMDAEMVSSHPEASYVVAVWEEPAEDADGVDIVNIGMCAVDVAAGQLLLGGWTDDEMRGGLRTHLASLQPVEVVLPKNGLSTASGCVLRGTLHSPQMNILKGDDGVWSYQDALQIIKKEKYFALDSNPRALPDIPDALQSLIKAGNATAMNALCGMLFFLREAILDKAVLPLRQMQLLPDPRENAIAARSGKVPFPTHMRLNAAALENLEVLQNAEGGIQGTLMQIVDFCKTPFGRRKLRQWLTRPLARVEDIRARQAAVNELIGSLAQVETCRKELSGVSDVERAVARLHVNAVSGPFGRNAPEVVLYEDVAKKKVAALRSAIMDFKAISAAVGALQQIQPSSAVLGELLSEEFWTDLRAALDDVEGAADWDEAATTGRVVPKREDVDPEYHAACQLIAEALQQMNRLLDTVKRSVSCNQRDVKYVTVNKDQLIEIPEAVKVPGNFSLAGQRKGYKRYTTEDLKHICEQLQKGEEKKEEALDLGLARLVKHFASFNDLWVRAVERVAEVDALLSLAGAALNGEGEMCCPEVVDPKDAPDGAFFSAKQLRHPASIGTRCGSFVPNDVDLGGKSPLMLLLTGPNMGGKSTLLRQVCCAVLLAQVGCWVPAQSMRFTPVDAVFVRMGARDQIMAGLSTFFVELLETGAMLQHATEHSLVALDELGRGTATSDGAAIAGAVLEHVTKSRKCRGMFATHYHYLAKEHGADPSVYVGHMGCAVNPGKDGRLPELTFLYKLTAGACPKSYGTNVAHLAGLPESVLTRASQISEACQEQVQEREKGQQSVADDCMALLQQARDILLKK